MNTQQVADKLVGYCREGKNTDAINELYDDNIVSREPAMGETTGKENVLQKTKNWLESVVEIHSGEISDPLVTGNHFSVVMNYDVTYKEHGRAPMHEIAVFEVKDGKVVSEQFFYTM